MVYHEVHLSGSWLNYLHFVLFFQDDRAAVYVVKLGEVFILLFLYHSCLEFLICAVFMVHYFYCKWDKVQNKIERYNIVWRVNEGAIFFCKEKWLMWWGSEGSVFPFVVLTLPWQCCWLIITQVFVYQVWGRKWYTVAAGGSLLYHLVVLVVQYAGDGVYNFALTVLCYQMP